MARYTAKYNTLCLFSSISLTLDLQKIMQRDYVVLGLSFRFAVTLFVANRNEPRINLLSRGMTFKSCTFNLTL